VNRFSRQQPLEDFVQRETLKAIDEALASAKATFPDAESFRIPPR